MSHLDVECLMCGEVFTVFYDADMDGKHNLSFCDPMGIHTIDDSRTTPLGNIVLKHMVVSSLPKPTDSMEGAKPNETKVGRYCYLRRTTCCHADCLEYDDCQGIYGEQADADIHTSTDPHAGTVSDTKPLSLASGHLHADPGANTVTEIAPIAPQPISTIAGTSVMITPQHNYVYRLDFGRRVSHLMLTERDAMELSKRLRDSIRAARKAQR